MMSFSERNKQSLVNKVSTNVDVKGPIRASMTKNKKHKREISGKKKEYHVKTNRNVYSKSWNESKRLVFSLGALLGLFLALYFGTTAHKQTYDGLEKYMNFESLQDYIVDWRDVLPSTISSLVADFQITNFRKTQEDLTTNFAVGRQLKRELNLTSKHPVIMVPGVTSTGIQSWGIHKSANCDSEPHFRKRLWGSFYMLKAMVLDKACWLKHVMLDPETGLDPPNYTLRAVQGFEAADFFVAGFWIWNKVLQNLGAIGYETNNMWTAAYDWRLAYLDLERRDQYFSKLKANIELNYNATGEKSVLFGHSMGAQVIFYFLKWVEAEGEDYGNGGDNWVETHIESFVNIAGTLLGVPKSVPALISGEMKDTIDLNALAMYGLEKFFSRKERLELLQTWGGIPSMLPKGGDVIWGNMNHSVEDIIKNTDSYGKFIRFDSVNNVSSMRNLTAKDSIQYIIDLSPTWLRERIKDQYSFGYAETEQELKNNSLHHSHWTNPLEVALPYAPSMKIYCLYGVGNPTERAYVYQEDSKAVGLNVTISYENQTPVFFTDGDGTVPVVSHAMCHKWAQGVSSYNPANISVKIVEMLHQPERFDMRGGAKSAEHVDILGRAELNEYLLKIAAGKGAFIESRFITNMTKWIKLMPFPL